MTETFIAHVNGSHACYQTRTGVDRAFIGCSHDKPREAITHTVERKGDTDALHLDRTGTSLVGGTPSSEPERSADAPRAGLSDGGSPETSRKTAVRLRTRPCGGVKRWERAMASASPERSTPPTDTPAPVGAPDLGLVP